MLLVFVADLYLSIKKDKIVLRSKKHNKEVLPRLSNAHNFSSNALPIYHFLCDIQNQETTGFGFNWGDLQYEFEFLPRLTYKDVILSKAKWNLSKKDIDEIVSVEESKAMWVVQDFRKKRNIPDIVNLTQGDNEVLINFNNDLSCLVFYSMLKDKSFVQLTEFYFEEKSITDNYCNEFIVFAHRNVEKKKEKNNIPIFCENDETVKSSFSIGEEWLYYKFYCGERIGEELLNRAINPIIEVLKSEKLIKKWFFIRYHDKNGHHIRFRVLLNHISKLGTCIELIKEHIRPFEDSQIIWKTQTDTYLRELQRYGEDTIEPTETLFFNDSECSLQFIDIIEGDDGEEIRWKFALLSMHSLLEDFNFTLSDRVTLLKAAKTGFGKEFNRSGVLNKQINEMYLDCEAEIENFLDETKANKEYIPLWDLIKERSKNNQEAIIKIKQSAREEDLFSIVLSYLHMINNRIFIAKQRVHEMVVYDYLCKLYNKKIYNKKVYGLRKDEFVVVDEL